VERGRGLSPRKRQFYRRSVEQCLHFNRRIDAHNEFIRFNSEKGRSFSDLRRNKLDWIQSKHSYKEKSENYAREQLWDGVWCPFVPDYGRLKDDNFGIFLHTHTHSKPEIPTTW